VERLMIGEVGELWDTVALAGYPSQVIPQPLNP
jgi:hypothetical protein